MKSPTFLDFVNWSLGILWRIVENGNQQSLSNLCKVNNKDEVNISGMLIVDFEQINAGWDDCRLPVSISVVRNSYGITILLKARLRK